MLYEEHQMLSHLARNHWWPAGRRKILGTLLDKYHPGVNGPVLDAGCGPGANLSLLAEYGQVTGVDSSPVAVRLCRERYPFPIIQAPVENLPFPDGYFQLVAALDLLEHVPDDRLVLKELHRVCAPGGWAILTVPAYPWLWSGHDEVLGHYRRYRLGSLKRKVNEAGFHIIKASHYNTFLLPAAVAFRLTGKIQARLRAKGGQLQPASDLQPVGPLLNSLLYSVFSLESRLIPSVSFPAGLSIVMVLERNNRF